MSIKQVVDDILNGDLGRIDIGCFCKRSMCHSLHLLCICTPSFFGLHSAASKITVHDCEVGVIIIRYFWLTTKVRESADVAVGTYLSR